ncbi:hypothetical protein HDV05_001100 [Chytridiales sp. JEL 0842]|nr:hypothetical protein HDV05_001100 [Chytridiales sp. JEL 0842]
MLTITFFTAFLAISNARFAIAEDQAVSKASTIVPTERNGDRPIRGGTRPPPTPPPGNPNFPPGNGGGGPFPPPTFPPGNPNFPPGNGNGGPYPPPPFPPPVVNPGNPTYPPGPGGPFPPPPNNEIYCNNYPQNPANVLYNTEIFGFDIPGASGYAQDYCTCERFCSQDTRCDFFVYNQRGYSCQLKALENKFSNAFTWFRTSGGGSAFLLGDLVRNYDIGGGFVVNNMEQCVNQCGFNSNNRCNAVTVVPYVNNRWLCYWKQIPSQSFGTIVGVNNRGQWPTYPGNPGPFPPPGPGPNPPPGPGPNPPPGPGPNPPPGPGGQCRANLLPQGYDIPGYDLASFDSPSICTCEQSCRQNRNCDFYVLRGRYCYLKTLQRKNEQYYSWFKTTTCQGGSSLILGTIDGYDIAQPYFTRNVQECQNACYNNPSCLFIATRQSAREKDRVYCALKAPQRAGLDTRLGVLDRDAVNRVCGISSFRGLASEGVDPEIDVEATATAASTPSSTPAIEVAVAKSNATETV